MLITEDKKVACAIAKVFKKKWFKVYFCGCVFLFKLCVLSFKSDIWFLFKMLIMFMFLDFIKLLKLGCHGWSLSYGVVFCVLGDGSW